MLGHPAINGDKKNEFLRALADLIELTPQTASTLTTTLRVHVVLIGDLLTLISMR